MLKKGLFLLALLFFSSTSMAASRISPPGKEQAIRCLSTGPSKEKAAKQRERALKMDCITKDEFDLLASYEGYPVCNEEHKLEGWCPPGCFVRGTMILVTNKESGLIKYAPVEDIVANRMKYLVWCMTKSPNGIHFAPHKIKLTTQGPEEEPIIYVRLDNGNRIGLTSEHGVLLATGKVIKARSLNVGDQLYDLHHNPTTVIEMSQENTADLVFNLLVDDAESMENHFIIAEEIVVGDLAWQGSLQEVMADFNLGN